VAAAIRAAQRCAGRRLGRLNRSRSTRCEAIGRDITHSRPSGDPHASRESRAQLAHAQARGSHCR
jgi:hypothetical protein